MSVIDDYLSEMEPSRRPQLERIRRLTLQAAPDAEEVISYGMPAFKYKGLYLGGFKEATSHYGFYPKPGPIAALKNRLDGYELAKGTIQFTDDKPLPDELVVEIVRWRMAEIDKS